MSYCCVVGCSNSRKNSRELAFYTFPTVYYKKPQRDEWIKAVNRINADGTPWQPSKTAVICSAHFIGGEKSNHPHSPSFSPTIFPEVYSSGQKLENASENLKSRYQSGTRKIIVGQSNANTEEEDVETDKRQNDQLDIDIASGNEHVDNFYEPNNDKGIQCNIFSEEDSSLVFFMCNRTKFNEFCEAETQTCIPRKVMFNKKFPMEDKCCEESNDYTGTLDPDNTNITECISGFHGYPTIDNDQDTIDLTGLNMETFGFLMQFFNVPKTSHLSKENWLLIFLMKMKLGITFSVLGILFNTHRTAISRIFYSVLQELAHNCKHFVQWPPKTTIQSLMPRPIKEYHPDVRVMIDCTEIPVEQPADVSGRVFLFSQYKEGFRVKILVGCAPHGLISFVSRSYGGRATDFQVTTSFVNMLEPGDVVLTDKEFPEIKSLIDQSHTGVLVVMPPFFHDESFTPQETQTIAIVRFHVKRVMQRIKTFKILSQLSVQMLPFVDDIIFMCCALVNLQCNINNEDSVE